MNREQRIERARRAYLRQFHAGPPIRRDEVDGLENVELARIMVEVLREVCAPADGKAT